VLYHDTQPAFCLITVGYMFYKALAFNKDSNQWFAVGNLKYMEYMYNSASVFSKSLCRWGQKLKKENIQHPRDYKAMFDFSNCPNTDAQVSALELLNRHLLQWSVLMGQRANIHMHMLFSFSN